MIKRRGSQSKVLVLGACGFIGNHLMNAFQGQADPYDLYLGEDIFDQKLEELIPKYDIIYHLAAETSVLESFKSPEKFYYVNTLGTARVVQLCARYNKKLIYPSSAAVEYPDLSPYAGSKYLAEEIVKKFVKKIPIVILRFYNIFGPGMNARTGSVMYRFLKENPITIYGSGEQTRDFIHINDVISILLDAQKKKWDGQIVEIGTGRATSLNYVAELFSHYQGKKIVYKQPKREIKWSIADTSKLDMIYRRNLHTSIERDVIDLCTQVS